MHKDGRHDSSQFCNWQSLKYILGHYMNRCYQCVSSANQNKGNDKIAPPCSVSTNSASTKNKVQCAWLLLRDISQQVPLLIKAEQRTQVVCVVMTQGRNKSPTVPLLQDVAVGSFLHCQRCLKCHSLFLYHYSDGPICPSLTTQTTFLAWLK